MDDQNYTIKDIARMAGVSAGTVDRVLHNRGDVSEKSRLKVQAVLDEINYKPNVFAIGLAAKKKYTILCVIPQHVEHDYWHSVSLGINRAKEELRPFNVVVQYLYYQHGDRASYQSVCHQIGESQVDAVLLAPNFVEETKAMLPLLEEKNIPYVFIDFNIEEANALKYIGQDSYRSGYMAAKILMRNYTGNEEVVLFLSNTKDNPGEIQMRRRLDGFQQYLAEHHPEVKSSEVILINDDVDKNNLTLDSFFQSHPQATLGVVFNSRVYQVGLYLQQRDNKLKGLIGYDLLRPNVELLQSGYVTYLIGQRPGLQGYCGVKALTDHIVFKKPRNKVKYMPIDILLKDNIEFYFEFE